MKKLARSSITCAEELAILFVAAPATLCWHLIRWMGLASFLRVACFSVLDCIRRCRSQGEGCQRHNLEGHERKAAYTRPNGPRSPCITQTVIEPSDYLNHLRCPNCTAALRLTATESTQTEVIRGTLECLKCGKTFQIREGLADLTFPESLEDSDLASRAFYDKHPNYDYRFGAFRLGIWERAFRVTWARSQWASRLRVGEGQSVLETGVGCGDNLPFIASAIGNNGRLAGLDISSASLHLARERIRSSGIQAELVQGNASYLPYGNEEFDAVLHVGGFNEFADKKRAVEEMHRVAKVGARIVFSDEGLSSEKRKTLLGRFILKYSVELFASEPPVELLPESIEDLKVYWIYQGTDWVIEYRKGEQKSHERLSC